MKKRLFMVIVSIGFSITIMAHSSDTISIDGPNILCAGGEAELMVKTNLLSISTTFDFLLGSYDTILVPAGSSIQDYLDNADSGTVLLLVDGIYYENIVWPQTNHLILSSVNGPEHTIIDGSGLEESTIYIGNGQIGTVIDNLQIRKGYGTNPTFHSSTQFGGGILIDEDVISIIKNCLIIDNGPPDEISEYSGGIFISYRSEVHLYNNTIANNNGPGIWWRSGWLDIESDELSGREGSIVNCIINSNNGYGLYIQLGPVWNTTQIRYNNSSENIGFIYPSMSNWCDDNGPSSYTETGVNGNISQDPQFIDAQQGNYQLSPSSPSLDAGERNVKQGYEYSMDIYELLIPPLSYQWSTGDTTPSITISPVETTTYYVWVSNGVTSLTDSIQVTVSDDTSYTNIDTCDSYIWNNQILTESGTYYHTIPHISGCDSTIVLNLNIRKSTSDSLFVKACNSYYWEATDSTYLTSGTYTYKTTNLAGCDSILTLSLIITPSGFLSQPHNQYANTGDTVQFNITRKNNNTTVQWQSNSNNMGWYNIPLNSKYKGSSTDTLFINDIQLSNHLQPFRLIESSGNCSDTSDVAVLNIIDTCINYITVIDTNYISVTDTLIININLTGIEPPYNLNTITVYPNPASTHIYINNGVYSKMAGYSVKIVNNSGRQVFQSLINREMFYIDLSGWGSNGLYFLYISNPQNNIIEVKKIILK